jgi:glycosyltransferase involved in cell wall biosynthesis
LDTKPRIIATVINDVIYDQRMIRICTSLSADYEVSLWGRKKSDEQIIERPFKQKRFSFLINKGVTFYLLYNLKMFIHLLFAKFDIIHAVDLDTLPAGYMASRIRGKKLVYDSHEYFTEVPELINRPKKRHAWLRIEQAILPKVKNAMTVGQMIADAYTKKYKVKFEVVRNCPVKKEITKQTETEKYLVYQGALNKGRGLEATIEAMQQLDVNLKIAGSGDLDDELKSLVAKYKVEDKVEFLGLLKPEELTPLTRNAFAGINVSENLGLSYYYSLNNKYFDYIHAGLPAVTNEFPEYKLLNDDYKCSVFATAKSDDIVKAVNLLLDDTALYNELKKNCLLAREQLTWENEEKTLLKVYANIA